MRGIMDDTKMNSFEKQSLLSKTKQECNFNLILLRTTSTYNFSNLKFTSLTDTSQREVIFK